MSFVSESIKTLECGHEFRFLGNTFVNAQAVSAHVFDYTE